MNIYINNKEHIIDQATTVTDALNLLNVATQKGIAVAINNNVIPRSEWGKHPLNENDKITLIRAAQGG